MSAGVPYGTIGSVEARFWSKVERRGPDECWPWMAAKHDRGGYGLIRIDGKLVRASRFSLEENLGRPLRPGMVARHRCDNPPCCNPKHLLEGTQADNIHDAVSRKRHRHGENGAAKLTNESVLRIRHDVAAGKTHEHVAREYGISPAMASMVANGKRWAHIGGPLTSGVNKSHCINGHAYTHENTLLRDGGRKKVCRICNKINQDKYKQRKKESN